ncbi:hypothetical protein PVAND_004531 [Polypedilum vanderplanki]|uniref:HAT C-terminal dimerisation domain-containing protein n=1 Tax=Polypedilum vanderplanki TaxID=319348 RepID=A0A9J6BX93_POLVA|nr:hypothetical protein PVAND_004531 [Polypedilum vanderplanki]
MFSSDNVRQSASSLANIHNIESLSLSTQSNSLYDQLQSSLNILNTLSNSKCINEADLYKSDFYHHEKFDRKSPRLQFLLNALFSIPATSSTVERNFSMSNNVVSKQINRDLRC